MSLSDAIHRLGSRANTRCSSGQPVKLQQKSSRRDDTVRVLAQCGHRVPIDRSVEADADPTAMADVRWAKVTIRSRSDGFGLGAVRRGTPKVGEGVVVVPIRPQHHELLSPEERGRAVAETFRRPR